jgi:RNA polymerase sporulation-specific sigma factor
VAHIVKKFENTKVEKDDLLSIGTFGLIKAVDSYNFASNVRLATYASRCIENEILMHFRNNKKRNKDISINDSIGYDKEGNEITILDILKTPTPDFALDLHKENNITDLKKYLDVLNDREKEIIIYRYGLYDSDEITDDCMLLEMENYKVKIIEGEYTNIKITTKEDLDVITSFLKKE